MTIANEFNEKILKRKWFKPFFRRQLDWWFWMGRGERKDKSDQWMATIQKVIRRLELRCVETIKSVWLLEPILFVMMTTDKQLRLLSADFEIGKPSGRFVDHAWAIRRKENSTWKLPDSAPIALRMATSYSSTGKTSEACEHKFHGNLLSIKYILHLPQQRRYISFLFFGCFSNKLRLNERRKEERCNIKINNIYDFNTKVNNPCIAYRLYVWKSWVEMLFIQLGLTNLTLRGFVGNWKSAHGEPRKDKENVNRTHRRRCLRRCWGTLIIVWRHRDSKPLLVDPTAEGHSIRMPSLFKFRA